MTDGASGIEVRHLRKTFQRGPVQACRDVDLRIGGGELLVLVGPSGCGKTTTLRCIAGLESPDNGDAIWVNGRNVTRAAPKDRNLAFVFQDTALFPHLNVRRNISFGLDMRRTLPAPEIARRVEEAAKLLQVNALLDRKSSELSGGQGQRVALGRAIVMEPAAFLLDEPLANLDAALRVEMRTEIKRIQRKLATTMVFVTHDQEEALSLGDRIAVMDDGIVQQAGTPREVYLKPANLFVATFIGSPAVNRFDCRLVSEGGVLHAKADLFDLALPDSLARKLGESRGEITLGVRPEALEINSGDSGLSGRVSLVELLGSRSLVFVECGGREVRVAVQGETALREGETVRLGLPPERAFYFGQDGRNLLA
jgi:multiple sugar transport system ATP-binding protein